MVNTEHGKENHLIKVTETLPVIKETNTSVRKSNKLDGDILNINPKHYDNLALNMNYRAKAIMEATSSKTLCTRTGRGKFKSTYVEKDNIYLTKTTGLTLTEVALYDLLISIMYQAKTCKYNDAGENSIWTDKIKDGVILFDTEFLDYLGFKKSDLDMDMLFNGLYYLSRTEIFMTNKPISSVADLRKKDVECISRANLINFDWGYVENEKGISQLAFRVSIPTFGYINGVNTEEGYKPFNQYNTSVPRIIAKTIFKEPKLYWIARYIAFNFCQLKCNNTIRIETLMSYLDDHIEDIRQDYKIPSKYFEGLQKSILKSFKYFEKLELGLNVEKLGLRNYKQARIVWKNKTLSLPQNNKK